MKDYFKPKLIILFALTLSSCTASPVIAKVNKTVNNVRAAYVDFERLATAIRKAEGNQNYGILAHYRHTSYRQACINTCRHKYRQWALNGHKGAYLEYLASKYAPVGSSNDPRGLNVNWLSNVRYWYAKS